MKEQTYHPSQPAYKEGSFLPHLKDGGILSRFCEGQSIRFSIIKGVIHACDAGESGFMQGDQPFYSIGFNYHPSVSGCQYWIRWDEDEIDRDLRAMALRGFTVVRFFVFWADFEPQPGLYDEVLVGRLRRFVELAGSHGLYCVPALLTIWMNGQLFDLLWRAGRNLWLDSEMVALEVNYVAHLAHALADQEYLLAYDLGDELIHVDFASSSRLSPGAVIAWQTQLADAIRREHPCALVLQGQELSTVLGGHSFRPEYAQALDVIALHGYPLWSPLAIESVSSYKASQLVPFLVQLARVDGPALVDELGCYGADDEVGSGYVRASIHSALANGARGILAWCWQDFQTTEPPYDANPAERQVGFLDVSGNPRSVMPVFERFASRVKEDWGGAAHSAIPDRDLPVWISASDRPKLSTWRSFGIWSTLPGLPVAEAGSSSL